MFCQNENFNLQEEQHTKFNSLNSIWNFKINFNIASFCFILQFRQSSEFVKNSSRSCICIRIHDLYFFHRDFQNKFLSRRTVYIVTPEIKRSCTHVSMYVNKCLSMYNTKSTGFIKRYTCTPHHTISIPRKVSKLLSLKHTNLNEELHIDE